MKKLHFILIIVLLGLINLFFISCSEKDQITPIANKEDIQIIGVANEPIAIDFSSLEEAPQTTSVTNIQITKQPQFGELKVAANGTGIYISNSDITEGKDVFSYITESTTVEKTVTIELKNAAARFGLPCHFQISEKFTGNQDETINIELLQDAPDCANSFDLSTTDIIFTTFNGKLEETAKGKYTYTPEKGFYGIDFFAYKILDQSKGRKVFIPAKIDVVKNDDNDDDNNDDNNGDDSDDDSNDSDDDSDDDNNDDDNNDDDDNNNDMSRCLFTEANPTINLEVASSSDDQVVQVVFNDYITTCDGDLKLKSGSASDTSQNINSSISNRASGDQTTIIAKIAIKGGATGDEVTNFELCDTNDNCIKGVINLKIK